MFGETESPEIKLAMAEPNAEFIRLNKEVLAEAKNSLVINEYQHLKAFSVRLRG